MRADADAADLPDRLVRAAVLQWRGGAGEARIRLHPDHLGDLTISLRVEHGTVLAVVRTDTQAALDIVRSRQADLQAALGARGLQLDHLVVTLDPEQDRRPPAREFLPPPRPSRRGDGTAGFEIVV